MSTYLISAPKCYALCVRARYTRAGCQFFSLIISELKKLSSKNLHMSNVIITFDPSNNK